jgi:dTDP-glucose pyrophosphorylase
MNLVILAAGNLEEQFNKAGFKSPKNLLPVDGSPLIASTMHPLGKSSTRIYLVMRRMEEIEFGTSLHLRKALDSDLAEKIQIINVQDTNSSLATALLGIDSYSSTGPLIFQSSDILLKDSISDFVTKSIRENLDSSVLTVRSFEDRWSFVSAAPNGDLLGVYPKIAMSNQIAAGMYYFRDKETFLKSASHAILNASSANSKFHFSMSCMSASILGLKVKCINFPSSELRFLASPGDYQKYLAVEKNPENPNPRLNY